MSSSWSPPHSPIPESSFNLELTPSALRLLPKDLLLSPLITKWPSFEADSMPASVETRPTLCTAGNNMLHGLQLTTQSGVTVTIQDPRTAEQLVLNPLRVSLLATTRAWSANPKQTDLVELIQTRNMMSQAFEEYVNIFGSVPGHSVANASEFYLDYVCELVNDVTERNKLIRTLQRAQEQFCAHYNFRPLVSHSSVINDTNTMKTDMVSVNEGFTNKMCAIHGLNLADDFKQSGSFDTHILKTVKTKPIENTEPKVLLTAEEKYRDMNEENKHSTIFKNVQESNKLPKLNEASFNIRYKTQTCRHFAKSGGSCPAGDNCHFAHGPEELRIPQLHPKFRTKPCRNFSETGSCAFGDQCFFLHIDRTSESSENTLLPKSIKTDQNPR